MKSSEIRELSVQELARKIRDTRDEYLNLQLRKQTGQVEHPDQIKLLRRDIARMETILNQKKNAAATPAA